MGTGIVQTYNVYRSSTGVQELYWGISVQGITTVPEYYMRIRVIPAYRKSTGVQGCTSGTGNKCTGVVEAYRSSTVV
jgi:hypothetical protein